MITKSRSRLSPLLAFLLAAILAGYACLLRAQESSASPGPVPFEDFRGAYPGVPEAMVREIYDLYVQRVSALAAPVTPSSTPTGVISSVETPDSTFRLGEVYVFPNPAKRKNPTFRIEVGVADSVDLEIYNLAGRPVHEVSLTSPPRIMDDGQGPRYAYEYTWNVSGVSSGGYVYVVTARKGSETLNKRGKCIIVK